MLARALYSLGCLVLVKSLEHGHYSHHGQSELLVEVNAKANVKLQTSEAKGLFLAGSSALRQLGLRPRPGCKHSTNLVHRLQRSRANFSTNEMPLNYMHIDHSVYQVGLAVFDLWNDRNGVLEVLEEDASSTLQPFLEDVSKWREVCSAPIADTDKSQSAKALLVLPREQQNSHDNVSWDDMAMEFAIYVARKALRKRPEEIQVWKPKDRISLAELLSKDQGCFQSVVVLSGDPWSFAWAQHFRCNVQEGRLVLRFVEHVMRRHPVQRKNGSDADAPAQVCLSKGNPELLKPLELCELQGREVQIKVAPTAAEAAQCDAFLALPGTIPSGAELWLRESSSVVEILSKNKVPTTLIENLALLTGAKRFTLGSHLPHLAKEDNHVGLAERAILALNRAGPDAADGALDDSVAGVGQLEGCEEFYHPRDGWIEGWRDVARSLKLAKRGEGISVALDESKHPAEARAGPDSEGDPGHVAISEDSSEEETESAESDLLEDAGA